MEAASNLYELNALTRNIYLGSLKVYKTYWKRIYSIQNYVCILTPVEIKIKKSRDQERSMRCLKGIQNTTIRLFCNECIKKIKSRDNRLMNIPGLMNKNQPRFSHMYHDIMQKQSEREYLVAPLFYESSSSVCFIYTSYRKK